MVGVDWSTSDGDPLEVPERGRIDRAELVDRVWGGGEEGRGGGGGESVAVDPFTKYSSCVERWTGCGTARATGEESVLTTCSRLATS